MRMRSSRNLSSAAGFSTAGVAWKRNVLLAEPPPLAMKRNLYSSPSSAIEVDLRRQIVAGIDLLEHRQRRELAVAQIGLGIGAADAGGERRGVAAAGPDALALLAHDDRGAGVLAHRQHLAGGDVGVLQQIEGDEAVVVGGLGIVEDGAQLLQMAGAQQMLAIDHRLLRQQRQRRRLDLEHASRRRSWRCRHDRR